jgi:serpin B
MSTLMPKVIRILLPSLFLMTLSWPLMGASSESAASPIVEADNQFALDLYGQLDKEKPGENLFFSPTSISLALSMTAAGAKGQTEAEMAQVLHLTGNLPQAHAEYRKLLQRWNEEGKNRGYQLRVANRLWGQKGYSFLENYLTLTRQEYGAEMGIVDFDRQTEAARKTINTWVEQQTAEKIKNLIPEGVLDGMTRLILTNAIYFKGDWANQFKKEMTREEDFTVSATRKVKVPLMQQKRKYPYLEDDMLQALELPYKGEDLSMLVLLPKKIDGLTELEKSLSAAKIDALRSKHQSSAMMVFLPKFRLESSFTMNSTLQSMGMKAAFQAKLADFSGMDGKRDLSIGAVLHKAFVDVNEEGTEAAAASATILAAPGPIEPPPIIFRADHPFVFMICDKRDGNILFLGRVTNSPIAPK